jgi:hypothetical protein
MKLLTIENAKTVKGESLGYLTGILYLAPADESGVINTCPMASAGCKADCLFTAGRAEIFPHIIEARIRRTRELVADRAAFLDTLRADIAALVRKAARENLTPAVRLNGTSDLYWLVKILAPEFSSVQFYDYTKLPRPYAREFANYHLTFSLSENNWREAEDALQHGTNVAVVFDTKKGRELPASWRGYQVIDGDTHDLRFLNGHQSAIIGLRAKGRAKKDNATGFVQIAALATA